jgi:hypothetical protein
MARILTALAAIALLAQACFASSGQFGTRGEAVAMVKRVAEMFAKRGAEPTSKRFPINLCRTSMIVISIHSFTT